MDLLETMYSLKWLEGNFKGGYAYRSGRRVGFVAEQGHESWAAAFNMNLYDNSGTDVEVKEFLSEAEAKAYVETEWKKFVDDIMED